MLGQKLNYDSKRCQLRCWKYLNHTLALKQTFYNKQYIEVFSDSNVDTGGISQLLLD